jgi:hypothetical protein
MQEFFLQEHKENQIGMIILHLIRDPGYEMYPIRYTKMRNIKNKHLAVSCQNVYLLLLKY